MTVIDVVAAVLIRNQRVLVARRAAHKHDGGCWEFPGGKVEAGETPEGALRREIREELSATIEVGPALGTVQHPNRPLQLTAYRCTLRSDAQAGSDHDELRWITANELDALHWAPLDPPLLPAVRACLSGGHTD